MRSLRSTLLDTLYANKKRLAPTVAGLLRWLSAPARYDLIGVDVSKDASVTVKPKKPACLYFAVDYKSTLAGKEPESLR